MGRERNATDLYRAIVRAARGMDVKQKQIAMSEARAGFVRGANLAGEDLRDALDALDKRVEIAKHYGIAHERMTHAELAGGGNKDIEAPLWSDGKMGISEALKSTMSAQFPVNPAGAAARAKARAKRAAVANAETRGAL